MLSNALTTLENELQKTVLAAAAVKHSATADHRRLVEAMQGGMRPAVRVELAELGAPEGSEASLEHKDWAACGPGSDVGSRPAGMIGLLGAVASRHHPGAASGTKGARDLPQLGHGQGALDRTAPVGPGEASRAIIARLSEVRGVIGEAEQSMASSAQAATAALEQLSELHRAHLVSAVHDKDDARSAVRQAAKAASAAAQTREQPKEGSGLDRFARKQDDDEAVASMVKRVLDQLRGRIIKAGTRLEAKEAARRLSRPWDAALTMECWTQRPFLPCSSNAQAPRERDILARAASLAPWARTLSAWVGDLLLQSRGDAGDERAAGLSATLQRTVAQASGVFSEATRWGASGTASGDCARLPAFGMLVSGALGTATSVEWADITMTIAASWEAAARACSDCVALAEDARARKGAFAPVSGSPSSSPVFTGLVCDAIDGGGPLGAISRPLAGVAENRSLQARLSLLAHRVAIAERRVRLACLRKMYLETERRLRDLVGRKPAPASASATHDKASAWAWAPQGYAGHAGLQSAWAALDSVKRILVCPVSRSSALHLLPSSPWAGPSIDRPGARVKHHNLTSLSRSLAWIGKPSAGHEEKFEAARGHIVALLREADEYDCALAAQPWKDWAGEAAALDQAEADVTVRSHSSSPLGRRRVPLDTKPTSGASLPRRSMPAPPAAGMGRRRSSALAIKALRLEQQQGSPSARAKTAARTTTAVVTALLGHSAGRADDTVAPDEHMGTMGTRKWDRRAGQGAEAALSAARAWLGLSGSALGSVKSTSGNLSVTLPELDHEPSGAANPRIEPSALWPARAERLEQSASDLSRLDLQVRMLLLQSVVQSAMTSDQRPVLAMDAHVVGGAAAAEPAASTSSAWPRHRLRAVLLLRPTKAGEEELAIATGEPARIHPATPEAGEALARAVSIVSGDRHSALTKDSHPDHSVGDSAAAAQRRWDDPRPTFWATFSRQPSLAARWIGAEVADGLLPPPVAPGKRGSAESAAASLLRAESLAARAQRLCDTVAQSLGASAFLAEGDVAGTDAQVAMTARWKAVARLATSAAVAVTRWETAVASRAEASRFSPAARRRLLRCALLALPWPTSGVPSLVSAADLPGAEPRAAVARAGSLRSVSEDAVSAALLGSSFQYLHDHEAVSLISKQAREQIAVGCCGARSGCFRPGGGLERLALAVTLTSGEEAGRTLLGTVATARALGILVLLLAFVRAAMLEVVTYAIPPSAWEALVPNTRVNGDGSAALLAPQMLFAAIVLLVWAPLFQAALERSWASEGASLGRSVLPSPQRARSIVCSACQVFVGASRGATGPAVNSAAPCCARGMALRGVPLLRSVPDSLGFVATEPVVSVGTGWAGTPAGGHTSSCPIAVAAPAPRTMLHRPWNAAVGARTLTTRGRLYGQCFLVSDRLAIFGAIVAQASVVAACVLASPLVRAAWGAEAAAAVMLVVPAATAAVIHATYTCTKRSAVAGRVASAARGVAPFTTVLSPADQWHDAVMLLSLLVLIYLGPSAYIAVVPDHAGHAAGACPATTCLVASSLTQLVALAFFAVTTTAILAGRHAADSGRSSWCPVGSCCTCACGMWRRSWADMFGRAPLAEPGAQSRRVAMSSDRAAVLKPAGAAVLEPAGAHGLPELDDDSSLLALAATASPSSARDDNDGSSAVVFACERLEQKGPITELLKDLAAQSAVMVREGQSALSSTRSSTVFGDRDSTDGSTGGRLSSLRGLGGWQLATPVQRRSSLRAFWAGATPLTNSATGAMIGRKPAASRESQFGAPHADLPAEGGAGHEGPVESFAGNVVEADPLLGPGAGLAAARSMRALRHAAGMTARAEAALVQALRSDAVGVHDAGRRTWEAMRPPRPTSEVVSAVPEAWPLREPVKVDAAQTATTDAEALKALSQEAPALSGPAVASHRGRIPAYGPRASKSLCSGIPVLDEATAAGLLWAAFNTTLVSTASADDAETLEKTVARFGPGANGVASRGAMVLGRDALATVRDALTAARMGLTLLPSASPLQASDLPRSQPIAMDAAEQLALNAFGFAAAVLLCVLPLPYGGLLTFLVAVAQARFNIGSHVSGVAAFAPRAAILGPSGSDALTELVASISGAACVTNVAVLLLIPSSGWSIVDSPWATSLLVGLAAATAVVAARRISWALVGECGRCRSLFGGLHSPLAIYSALEAKSALDGGSGRSSTDRGGSQGAVSALAPSGAGSDDDAAEGAPPARRGKGRGAPPAAALKAEPKQPDVSDSKRAVEAAPTGKQGPTQPSEEKPTKEEGTAEPDRAQAAATSTPAPKGAGGSSLARKKHRARLGLRARLRLGRDSAQAGGAAPGSDPGVPQLTMA